METLTRSNSVGIGGEGNLSVGGNLKRRIGLNWGGEREFNHGVN